jgi:hypothetical protein
MKDILVHHLNQTANRVVCLPAHARRTRPIEPACLLALRLPHVSHTRPPGPGILTSGHLHHSPILRARFTLSSHTVALPHTLLLLRSLSSPATNDLNAALMVLAASSNPARSLVLLAGRLLPVPAPRCAQGPRPPPSAATRKPRSRYTVSAYARLMTTLLDSYVKCDDIASVQMVFDEMSIVI